MSSLFKKNHPTLKTCPKAPYPMSSCLVLTIVLSTEGLYVDGLTFEQGYGIICLSVIPPHPGR